MIGVHQPAIAFGFALSPAQLPFGHGIAHSGSSEIIERLQEPAIEPRFSMQATGRMVQLARARVVIEVSPLLLDLGDFFPRVFLGCSIADPSDVMSTHTDHSTRHQCAEQRI
jgi:hypothetical protein